MDSLQIQCEELLRQLEKVLREADEDVARAHTKTRAKRRRNAINAACNALHRAVTA